MKPPLILLSLCLAFILPATPARCAPVKVACVGDSITFGMGAHRGWDYPSQLQRMLGAGYVVRNFGVPGATLLTKGDHPYDQTPALKAALAWQGDITILMLGANDTKPQNWGPHQDEFEADYRMLVATLQAASPGGKLFVCRPTWTASSGRYGINEPTVELEILIIDKVAASLKLPEIDMNAAIKGRPEDLVDTVHPNNAGATLLAKAAYRAITGNDFQGPVPPPAQ
jgi:lysophospholipase L1-like esterase